MRGMRTAVALMVALAALGSTRAEAAEVEITAAESVVHTAPFEVAPPLTRVHAGDRLAGDADAQSGWLRVTLPDGRTGFLRAGDAHLIAAAVPPPQPPAAAPLSTPAEPPVASLPPAAPPVVVSSPAPSVPPRGPALLGVMFELLPVGSLRGSTNGTTVTSDALVTVALAPFLDVPLSPWFAVGVSPQFVFKVKSGGTDSTTEYDLRARLTVRDPVTPTTRMFFRFSPGYSILSVPAGVLPDSASTPGGAYFDFAVGSEVTVAPGLILVVDLGYQFGFQGTTLANGAEVDYRTQFVHLGVGMALGL
jgi:hypothetical protein